MTPLLLAIGAVLSLVVIPVPFPPLPVDVAAGGYSFADAAKEAPATKDFHSNDGVLTFAIVTHASGNAFFDPVYAGAMTAANAIGAKLLLLGAESPTDDPARQIEILHRILSDPSLDGLILTTPRAGSYDTIVRMARERGIPIATTNAFDPDLFDRNRISHTGQDASAAAILGEALVQCLIDRGVASGTIILPNDPALANTGVAMRVTAAFDAIVAALEANGLTEFVVDAGPEHTGVRVDRSDPANALAALITARGDVVGALAADSVFTPALAEAVAQTGATGKICAYGYDLGPAQRDALVAGTLTGVLGQQPFLQGFWPVMQLYLEIDRGISATNLDTGAIVVNKDTLRTAGERFEN